MDSESPKEQAFSCRHEANKEAEQEEVVQMAKINQIAARSSNNACFATGQGLKKGPWTAAEDEILKGYVKKNGEGNWNSVQKATGLMRCGKSCRLRWANHLRPDLKKGGFSDEEEKLIVKLHAKYGNKWARMAAQLPGRTDNEIKNYWNTRLKRRQRAGLPPYPPEIQQKVNPFYYHKRLQHQQQKLSSSIASSSSSTSPFLYPSVARKPIHSVPISLPDPLLASTLAPNSLLQNQPGHPYKLRPENNRKFGLCPFVTAFPYGSAPSCQKIFNRTVPPNSRDLLKSSYSASSMFEAAVVNPELPSIQQRIPQENSGLLDAICGVSGNQAAYGNSGDLQETIDNKKGKALKDEKWDDMSSSESSNVFKAKDEASDYIEFVDDYILSVLDDLSSPDSEWKAVRGGDSGRTGGDEHTAVSRSDIGGVTEGEHSVRQRGDGKFPANSSELATDEYVGLDWLSGANMRNEFSGLS